MEVGFTKQWGNTLKEGFTQKWGGILEVGFTQIEVGY